MAQIPRRSRLPRSAARQLMLSAAVLAALAVNQLVQPRATAAPPAPAEAAAPLSGRPTRITDGDTFRFGQVRVRLQGIDAPEMSSPGGAQARRHLAALIGEGVVRCDDTGQRSYARVVAICATADGRDLGASMVEAGWAADWPRFSGGRYAQSQAEAMRDRRGMYGG